MNLKDYIQDHKSSFDDQKISSNIDAIFKDRLQKELHQSKKGVIFSLKNLSIAASVVLLISFGFWFQIDRQNIKEQSLLLASLQNDSAGERLEGIYKFNDEYSKEDDQIISTLIKILHDDKNANVKIATIDALLKFPQNEKIRKNLISAIEKEKLPLVQIKLIKSLSFLREHRAQKPLEEIINNEQTFPIVKSNAALAMANLKQ
jgi:hypothetical protein